MGVPTRVPQLARPIIKDNPELQRVVDGMIETMEIREGRRGEKLDRGVTFRDLVGGGFARAGRGSGGTPVLPIAPPGVDELPDMGPSPPSLQCLEVTGSLGVVFVTWCSIAGAFRDYAFANVYRSTTSDFGTALLLGTALGGMYVDRDVVAGQQYCYWVTAVGTGNHEGPINATEGTCATVLQDPAYLLDLLEGQITESQLYTSLGDRIDLIDAPTTGLLAKTSGLQSQITTIEGQLADIEGTPAFDVNESYLVDQLVTYEGGLYRSILATTAPSPLPTNETYWEKIGNYASLGDAVAAHAVQISDHDTRIEVAEGEITATATDVTAIQAAINHADTGLSANATKIDGVEASVQQTDDNLTALTTDYNITKATVNDPITGLSTKATHTDINQAKADIFGAEVDAFTGLEATFTGINNDIATRATVGQLDTAISTEQSARAAAIQTVEGEIDDNTAAIQTKASVDLVGASAANLVNPLSRVGDSTRWAFPLGTAAVAMHTVDGRTLAAQRVAYDASHQAVSDWFDVADDAVIEVSLRAHVGANGRSYFGLHTRGAGDGAPETAVRSVSATAALGGVTNNPYWNSDLTKDAWTTYRCYILGPQANPTKVPRALNVSTPAFKLEPGQTRARLRLLGGHAASSLPHVVHWTGVAARTLAASAALVLAEYSVKLDVNGLVTGFGLMNDGQTSSFGVRADQFWIAGTNESATNNPDLSKVPFIVRTSPTVINGEEVEAGTYIRSAMIEHGVITKAHIADGFLTNLTADKGIIDSALVTNAEINQAFISGDLRSGYADRSDPENWTWVSTFVPGSTGWIIRNDGTAEFNNAVFRGVVEITGGSVPYGYVSGAKPPADADSTTTNIGNQPTQDAIIVLCRRGSGNNNFVLGAITGKRVSGNTDAAKVDVVVNHDSNGVPSGNINVMGIQGHPDDFSLVTFTYNGVTWVGLRHRPNSQYQVWSSGTYFVGQTASSNAAMFWVATSAVTGMAVLNSKHVPYGSIEQWRRAGQTTIDGDKIFTGSAYVNTLQIRHGAVSATEVHVGAVTTLAAKGLTSLNGGGGSAMPVPESDGWTWLGAKGIYVPNTIPSGTVVLVYAQMEVQNATQSVQLSAHGFKQYVDEIMRNASAGTIIGPPDPHGMTRVENWDGQYTDQSNVPGRFAIGCTFRASGVADQVSWVMNWGDAIQGMTLLAFFPVVGGRTYSARFRCWNGTNHAGKGWVRDYMHLAVR